MTLPIFSARMGYGKTLRSSALRCTLVAAVVCIASGCAPSGGPGGSSANDAGRPNILLVVTDDQGYADLSAFAHHASDVSTPNMDRIAGQGVLFTQAYTTAPVCSPSRGGLNTGRYQFRWDEEASWAPGLPNRVRTLAERLQRAGYVTARFGKNDYGGGYHSHTAREYPLNHGYDTFLGFSAHAQDFWLLSEAIAERTPDPDGASANLGPLMKNEGWESFEEGHATDLFTDAAVRFLEDEAGGERPFFLTLSYSAVHHLVHEVPAPYLDGRGVEPIPPYDPSTQEAFQDLPAGSYSAYYEKYSRLGAIGSEAMRQYYLASLSHLDDNIGRVLDALDRVGLSGNTLLVLLSDNGGSPLTGASNAPLTGGKYSLHEGGIRVPFAMRWPGRIPAGGVHEHLVSALDVVPTALDAAGLALPSDTLDGVSLLRPVQAGAPGGGGQRTLFWRWQDTFAIRQGDWKLTNAVPPHLKSRPSDRYVGPRYETQAVRLFDLEGDPEESADVAGDHPEVVQRLQRRYEAWLHANTGRY